MAVLLLIDNFMNLPLFVGFCVWYLYWYSLLYVFSSFAIILTRRRELVGLLELSTWCLAILNVLWLFLTVPLVDLRCVNVVFPDYIYLLFTQYVYWNKHPVSVPPSSRPIHYELKHSTKVPTSKKILIIWAAAWDFQQCGMCDQRNLRPACAYVQSDQSLC